MLFRSSEGAVKEFLEVLNTNMERWADVVEAFLGVLELAERYKTLRDAIPFELSAMREIVENSIRGFVDEVVPLSGTKRTTHKKLPDLAQMFPDKESWKSAIPWDDEANYADSDDDEETPPEQMDTDEEEVPDVEMVTDNTKCRLCDQPKPGEGQMPCCEGEDLIERLRDSKRPRLDLGPTHAEKQAYVDRAIQIIRASAARVILDGTSLPSRKHRNDGSASHDSAGLSSSTQSHEDMAADRKSTRLNSSHIPLSRMPSSA